MQAAMVVGGQVIIMGLLTLVGIYSKKSGFLNEMSARHMSAFLLNVALGAVHGASSPFTKVKSLYHSFFQHATAQRRSFFRKTGRFFGSYLYIVGKTFITHNLCPGGFARA